MIIPIGHEDTQLRSVPWVTFSLIGICVIVYLGEFLYFTNQKQHRERELIQEIVMFWFPRQETLEVPDDIGVLLDRFKGLYDQLMAQMDQIRQMHEQTIEKMDEYGAEVPELPDFEEMIAQQFGFDPQELGDPDEEQALFDEMVTEFRGVSKQLYWLRMGYVPKNGFGMGAINHIFMHGGFWHLFFNMLFLYLFGPLLEDRYGKVFFGAFFILAGIFSGVMYGIHVPDSSLPLIGASGAISAVLGGMMINFYKTRLRMLLWIWVIVRVFMIPAWIAIIFWFGRDLLLGLLVSSVDPAGEIGGTAYWAHVWGVVFGAGICFGLKQIGLEERFFPAPVEEDSEDNDPLRAALKEERLGNNHIAVEILRRACRNHPDDVDLLQNYWRLAKQQQSGPDMTASALKLMQLDVKSENPKMAHIRWRELIETVPSVRLSPKFLNQLIEALVKDRYFVEAEDILVHTYEHMTNPTPILLMPLVEMAAEMDLEIGLTIAQQLREMPDFENTDKLDDLEDRIRTALSQGSPAQDISLSVASGGDGLDLADAHEFDMFDQQQKQVHSLKVFPAVPTTLDRDGLRVEVSGKARKVPFEQLKVVGVGAIREEGQKPYLIIDLVFDRLEDVQSHHRVLRLSSTSFNPRALLPQMENAGAAFKRLVDILVKGSGATPLPSPEAVIGKPYSNYSSVRAYEREIYYT